MAVQVQTVTFQGINVLGIEVQAQISAGLPAFTIVGLPDKAVTEARERVRSALHSLGLSIPPKRLTINMAPADVQKVGSHFDLPIALALLAAMDVIPADTLTQYVAMGELSLDGRIRAVSGVLPATMHAHDKDYGVICPFETGPEAAWITDADILAPKTLLGLINHFKGSQVLTPPKPPAVANDDIALTRYNFSEVRGQETAKRAIEVAAAGGHNLLMVGPPGAGKSMLAARIPSILPPLSPEEALEVSMIHSVAGHLHGGQILRERPYRDPHHSASLPALVGGGHRANPGEISLAHNGILFLDELPEFSRATLESLRQPLETGETLIARANAHVTYPSRFQLIAAMNPCKCGGANDGAPCKRGARCADEYQAKLSGPLLDRIDIHIDVPAVKVTDLKKELPGEPSALIAERVNKARQRQKRRFNRAAQNHQKNLHTNAQLSGDMLDQYASPDERGQTLLNEAVDKMHLSARAYHRVLRVARTIADLSDSNTVEYPHIAEALSYRRRLNT